MNSQHRRTRHANVKPHWRRRKRGTAEIAVSERPPKVVLVVGWAEPCERISKITERTDVQATVSGSIVEASEILRVGLCPDLVLVQESVPGGTWGSLVAELHRLGVYPEVIVHTNIRGWRRVLSRGGYCLLAERTEDLTTLFP